MSTTMRMANAGSCSMVRSPAMQTWRASAPGSAAGPPCTRTSSACGRAYSPTARTSSIVAPARPAAARSASRSNEATTPGLPGLRTALRIGERPLGPFRGVPPPRARRDRSARAARIPSRVTAANSARGRSRSVTRCSSARNSTHDPISSRSATPTVTSGEMSDARLVEPAQRHEGEDERGEEDADRVLDEVVAPEPQHEPRRVRAGRELHDEEHAREHEAGEGDHAGRRGDQHVARRVDVRRAAVARLVDLRGEVAEQDRAQHIERRQDDQALPVPGAVEHARAHYRASNPVGATAVISRAALGARSACRSSGPRAADGWRRRRGAPASRSRRTSRRAGPQASGRRTSPATC